VSIESSISSASIKSSSLSLADESEPIIFTLPKELETVIRSAFAIVDHKEPEALFMASDPMPKCIPFFLLGIFIALPVMVGDESGEDCSARVE
jgi:hypothetical protein